MRREKGIKNSPHQPPQNRPTTNPRPALFRPSSPIREEKYPQVEHFDDRPIVNKMDDKKKNLFSPGSNSPPIMKGTSRRPIPQPQPIESDTPSSPIHKNEVEYSPPPVRHNNKPKKVSLVVEERMSQREKSIPINIEDHPVIQHLREETALAIQEATQARRGNY